MYVLILAFIAIMLLPGNAWAYVGPGLGLGAIGAFLGGVIALLLGILGIFWYPFKRLIKKIKSKRNPVDKSSGL